MAEKGGETRRGRGLEKRRKEQAERTELLWEKGLVGQKKIEKKIEKKGRKEDWTLRVKGKEYRRNKKRRIRIRIRIRIRN